MNMKGDNVMARAATETKVQSANRVKAESKQIISEAKTAIAGYNKKISEQKASIKALKNSIKSQKAVIKQAKADLKRAKTEAKCEIAAEKAARKAEAAAKKAEKAANVAGKTQKDILPSDDDSESHPAGTANAVFIIKPAGNNGRMFNLVAADGQNLATSQIYTTADACYSGIKSVSVNSGAQTEDQTVKGFTSLPYPKYELYLDKSGEAYRFRLRAKNGMNILASPAYKTKKDCLAGIERIRENAYAKIIESDK